MPVLWHRETHSSRDALECDWFSHFITFLSEGWKLVEILFDSSVRHRGERHLWNGIIEGRIERERRGWGWGEIQS